MAILTAAQVQLLRLRLTLVEGLITTKRADWNLLYRAAVKKQGPSVSIQPGTKEYQVWSDLLALREERNNLLAELRANGQNI